MSCDVAYFIYDVEAAPAEHIPLFRKARPIEDIEYSEYMVAWFNEHNIPVPEQLYAVTIDVDEYAWVEGPCIHSIQYTNACALHSSICPGKCKFFEDSTYLSTFQRLDRDPDNNWLAGVGYF